TNDDVNAGLNIGIAGFANLVNAASLDTDISFNDAPVIKDEYIGNHHIDAVGVIALTLTHAITDHLTTAKFDFFTVDRVIFFDSDPQFCIAQSHAIADGGAKDFGVSLATDAGHTPSKGPITSPLKPYTMRSPASCTSSTFFSWPGSNRTAVPAMMLSR